MSLVEFILLILACYGVTFSFVHAIIMDKIGLRQFWQKFEFFKDLFHCSFCTGFWIGIFFGLSCLLSLIFLPPIVFYILTIPFAMATSSFFIDRIVIFLDNKIIEQEKK